MYVWVVIKDCWKFLVVRFWFVVFCWRLVVLLYVVYVWLVWVWCLVLRCFEGLFGCYDFWWLWCWVGKYLGWEWKDCINRSWFWWWIFLFCEICEYGLVMLDLVFFWFVWWNFDWVWYYCLLYEFVGWRYWFCDCWGLKV